MPEKREYVDPEGRTYLLTKEDAEKGDFKPVSRTKQSPTPQNKAVEPERNK